MFSASLRLHETFEADAPQPLKLVVQKSDGKCGCLPRPNMKNVPKQHQSPEHYSQSSKLNLFELEAVMYP